MKTEVVSPQEAAGETDQQEVEVATSLQEVEAGTSQKTEDRDDVSETGEGYVVYARCGEGDVFEVENKNAKVAWFL